MASLKDIKRRIQAVKGTQKVTRAMKLVAAAKLRRAQQTAEDASVFASELYNAAMNISSHLGPRAPFMWQRPRALDCIDVVVITSDRGLCGGFNENLLRSLEEEIVLATEHNIRVRLYALGRKGFKYLSLRRYDVHAVPTGKIDDESASWIAKEIMDRYGSGQSAGSNVVFNKFINAARHETKFWNLLPLYKRGSSKERNLDHLYEPEREVVLEQLCKQSITSTIKFTILESRAAEMAARMTAMDSATKNASDMISHLTFVYNRTRQEEITSELMDIVGGAEALKK